MTPTLTVVVIVYNDAARLPTAVRSVLRQSLRDLEIVIVDDASTDETPAVAASLAAADPDRVRVLRQQVNSGGCSRPRNAGLDVAEGRYVMFLDSDDVLPRAACARMVATAEREQADFVAGLCHRVRLSEGGQIAPWYRALYSREATYTSILENPGLLYDTLSTNKCYRRSFLDEHRLRFPDGYHYEDLLFSGQVYLHARKFTLIPDVVYQWNVVTDTQSPSITHRRAELRNFEDRLRIHRMLDEAFSAHGAVELKLHKDVKFLRHDLLLYLRDLPWRDAAYRSAFLELAAGYVQTLDKRAFSRVHPVQAITAWLLHRRDEPNLFTAIDFVAHGERLSARLARVDGRIYWCPEHLDDAEARAILDVTDLGFHDRPLDQLRLAARADALELPKGRLVLRGELSNPLGRIAPDAELSAQLVLTRGGSSRPVAVRLPRPRHDGSVLRWEAEVDLAATIPATLATRTWNVALRLVADGHTVTAPVAAADPAWDGRAAALQSAAGRALGSRARVLVTPIGDLTLQSVPERPAAARVEGLRRRFVLSPRTRPLRTARRRVRTLLRDPRHPRLREELFARTLPRLLPAPRRPLVVFESGQGRRFGGDPRAVYDEIVRRGLDVDLTWAFRDSSNSFTTGKIVRHGSWRYFVALARAWAWVEDEGVPREAAKRAHCVYVQTQHGTPVGWTGYDDVELRRAPNDERDGLLRRVRKWDVLLLRSTFEEDVFAQAFRSTAMPLRAGAPRNDRLVRADPDEQAALRARLRLDDDDVVVVWVPSCDQAVLTPSAEALGCGQRLLVWQPEAAAGGDSNGGDVSGEDLAALLAIADVLVTDHHPAMLDLPLRRRPVVLVGCRCHVRAVAGERPTSYLDLDHDAPGPVVWDATALAAELRDVDALQRRTLDRLERAAVRFGTYDDGRAAAAVVDELLRRWAAASPRP